MTGNNCYSRKTAGCHELPLPCFSDGHTRCKPSRQHAAPICAIFSSVPRSERVPRIEKRRVFRAVYSTRGRNAPCRRPAEPRVMLFLGIPSVAKFAHCSAGTGVPCPLQRSECATCALVCLTEFPLRTPRDCRPTTLHNGGLTSKYLFASAPSRARAGAHYSLHEKSGNKRKQSLSEPLRIVSSAALPPSIRRAAAGARIPSSSFPNGLRLKISRLFSVEEPFSVVLRREY